MGLTMALEQLSLDYHGFAHTRPAGQVLADAGIQRAADHAEAECPGWLDMACGALERFAAKTPEFAIEDFRRASADVLPAPASHKAWGALGRAAILRGIIRSTGRYEPARSAKTHGHPVRIYTGV